MSKIEAAADSKSVPLTVYFDGACPLCATEIDYYRRQDTSKTVRFVDASYDGTALGTGLTKDQAMERFHVRGAEGTLMSGAAAFIHLWQALPRWKWVARIARRPPALIMLEIGYQSFLRVRPGLSKLALRLKSKRY